ncbi:hypothetical protein BJX76DRAFT_182170 [Aspergillus varians]
MPDHYDPDPYARSSFRGGYPQEPYSQGYQDQDDTIHSSSATPRTPGNTVPQHSRSTRDPSRQVEGSRYIHSPGGTGDLHAQSPGWPDNRVYDRGYAPVQENYRGYQPGGPPHSDPYPAVAPAPNMALSARRPSYTEPSSHPEPRQPVYLSFQSILDPRYVVQSRSYYRVGRVFAVLWHENYGHGNGGTVGSRGPQFIGRFQEPIFSTIRRMVVVKVHHDCSWCIAINTYGGQGVAKRNVDRSKHAVVYMSHRSPFTNDDEPRMIKEPLEVSPDRPGEGLDEMSRLNFGKVHTVEHNVKVLPIGEIASRSMTRFREYAREELRLS